MKTMIKTSTNLLSVMLLGFILAMPTVAMAGRDHHRQGHHYGHSSHYDRPGRGYNQSHYKQHKHSRRHNHIVYNQVYIQPRGYYNRQYSQPGYDYVPGYNHYYPNQPYGYPPNVGLDINTGNTRFMLRY
ncbi:MAG: hypothetical protein Q8K59_11175 [Nitrosomonas sp.]|nr:hypothetical protein [Nitrosomonas sp.]MDP1951631.1 hypothetical protein [Nitrosomonas sp.]